MALTVSVAEVCHDTVFACQGVEVPDIEVQITTLVRIAFHKLREARADGDAIRIHYAAKLVDNLLDQ